MVNKYRSKFFRRKEYVLIIGIITILTIIGVCLFAKKSKERSRPIETADVSNQMTNAFRDKPQIGNESPDHTEKSTKGEDAFHLGERVVTFDSGTELYYIDEAGSEPSILLRTGQETRELCKDSPSYPVVQISRKNVAYIHPFEWEQPGEISVYNWEKDLNYPVLKREDIPDEYTPKEVYWINERYLIAIVGYAYGTVSVGGDVYIIDSETYRYGVYLETKKGEEVTDIYAIGGNFVFLTATFSEDEQKYVPGEEKIVSQDEIFQYAGHCLANTNETASNEISLENTNSKQREDPHIKDQPIEDNQIITFKDAEFENLIRSIIQKPTGHIERKDLHPVKEIYLYGQCTDYGKLDEEGIDRLNVEGQALSRTSGMIENIDEIKYFENLERLILARQNIKDISALRHLEKLEYIDLSFNHISAISNLENLSRLEFLNVLSNACINPNFTGLKNLKELYVDNIRNTLTLTPFESLEKLVVRVTQDVDMSTYTNMKELHISSSKGQLILPPNVETLHIFSMENPNTLLNCTSLKRLHTGLKNENLHIISSLVNLEEIKLYPQKEINDISFLQNLTKLKILEAPYNAINDITALENLKNLTYLDLGCNDIESIEALEKLKNLNTLRINSNDIRDISVLATLKKLQIVDLRRNNIVDLGPIVELENLKELNIESNPVKSLSDLRKMSVLPKLDIRNSKIPYKMYIDSAINGIDPGNLINGGGSTTDGKNVFFETVTWGDLPHPELVKRNIVTDEWNHISGQITSQMAEVTGQAEGGYIDEFISYLNVYNGKLYYFSYAANASTNDIVGEGEYYWGDDISGITSMNTDGTDRKLIKCTRNASFINVFNGKLYYIGEDKRIFSMNLDGTGDRQVLDVECSYLYVCDNILYYMIEAENRLCSVKLSGEDKKTIIEKSIKMPIIYHDKIYYINFDDNVFVYDRVNENHQQVWDIHTFTMNISGDSLYFPNMDDINLLYKINLHDGKKTKIGGYAHRINVVGDYLFIDTGGNGYYKIKNDGTEREEYFD